MKNQTLSSIVILIVLTVLLSLAGGLACAAAGEPMTPELAAKKENYRKQQEQRITPEKRKVAIEALKAERLRIQKAKEAVQPSTPVTIDNK